MPLGERNRERIFFAEKSPGRETESRACAPISNILELSGEWGLASSHSFLYIKASTVSRLDSLQAKQDFKEYFILSSNVEFTSF